MKIFALGGYGKTALPAVKLLAQSDQVTEIAIAGRNLERAEKAARDIGDKTIAVQADGTDTQMLAPLLAGYDIVMNAAYSPTILSTIRACIKTGTNYCDVSWGDAAQKALLLASEAKTSGITGIIATGVSPCISNLMGVHVARQLDEVEQLQIGRADIYNFETGEELTPDQWLKEPEKSLTALHKFRSFLMMNLNRLQEKGSRKIRHYHNHQWTDMDPVRNGLEVPLTQGNTITAYPYLCADDAWGALPHNLSAVTPVELAFSPFPPQLHNMLRELALRILGGDTNAEGAMNTFFDTIEGNPQRWLTLSDDFVPISKMWVRAVGRKDGHAARCCSWFTPAMWNVGGYFLTSVALATVVFQILRGEVKVRGIIEAEKAFEPLTFLDEVAAFLPELPPGEKMTGEAFVWSE